MRAFLCMYFFMRLRNRRNSDKDESKIIIKFKLFGGLNGVDERQYPDFQIYLSRLSLGRRAKLCMQNAACAHSVFYASGAYVPLWYGIPINSV